MEWSNANGRSSLFRGYFYPQIFVNLRIYPQVQPKNFTRSLKRCLKRRELNVGFTPVKGHLPYTASLICLKY